MKRSPVVVFSLVVAGLVVPVLSAQEGDENPPVKIGIGVQTSQIEGEGGELVVGQTIVASSFDGQNMQFFASPAMGMFGAPDMQSMLQDMQVQQELGLVEDQMNEIREIQKEFQRQMQEQSKSIFNNGKVDPTRAREMGEQMQRVQATMKEKLNGVLLPHQQKRLEQLGRHMEMQNRPGGQAVFAGQLAQELELTDEQKEELRERAGEIEKELEEKIAALRKKAREDLLKGLTSKQREKLDELLGDEFDYQPPKPMRALGGRNRPRVIRGGEGKQIEENKDQK